jgi:putative ABC transport system substrate-binding protein
VLALLAALAATRPGFAQQTVVRRIAWLSVDREANGSAFFSAFSEGMRDLGYIEGSNLTVNARWGEGSVERLDQQALELARSNAEVIVAQGGLALRAAIRAKPPMPIVFAFTGDPLAAGLIDSLARPGRNLTGVTFLSLELAGKRIEMLKEVLPSLRRLAVLANPEHPGDRAELHASQAVATQRGIGIDYFQARTEVELEASLAAIAKARSEAVVVFPDAITIRARDRIAAFSLQQRIPAISGWAQFADAGNLMSYGPNLRDSYRRLAAYADKILKGTPAAELPVELPTTVEFVVNLKTARALGIAIPQSVLLRADRVIE